MKKKGNVFSRQVIRFKQWSRKNYAVMSSIGRVVQIGTIALTYGLVATPAKGEVTIDSVGATVNYETIDEVTVVSEASEQLSLLNLEPITVISKSDINRLSFQSIEDILAFTSSIDIRQRGAYSIQSDLSLKGGSFDQTMILLNGINITDPQTGHLSLNIPIDFSQIDRIEVLPPGQAKIYGSNAFTGAINIITQPQRNNVNMDVMAGENGLYAVNVGSSFELPHLKQLISVGKSSSDGYIHNTDFKKQNVFYQAQFSKKDNYVNYQMGYIEKEYGANGFYSPKYPDQFENNKTFLMSLSSSSGTTSKLNQSIYWKRNFDNWQLDRNNPMKYQNFHQTDVWGASVFTKYDIGFLKLKTGGNIRTETILSSSLGETLPESRSIEWKDAKFIKHFTRSDVNAYVNPYFEYKRLSIDPYINVNYYTSLYQYSFLPAVEIRYKIGSRGSLFLSYDKTMRLPTFTDLYYKGVDNKGNPLLKPELSENIEGGVRYQLSKVSGSISTFYRKGTDVIDWVREHPDSLWIPENFTQLNTIGATITAAIEIPASLKAITTLQNIRLSYTYMEIDKSSDEYISKYVLDNLRHNLSINMVSNLYRNLFASCNISYQNRDGNYLNYNTDTKIFTETPYGDFWLTDVRVSYVRNNKTVYVEASNIFNQQYEDIGNVIQPGRWLRAGVKFRFNY